MSLSDSSHDLLWEMLLTCSWKRECTRDLMTACLAEKKQSLVIIRIFYIYRSALH